MTTGMREHRAMVLTGFIGSLKLVIAFRPLLSESAKDNYEKQCVRGGI